MITADKLKWGSSLDAVTLTALVQGGPTKRKDRYTGVKFLGVTNGGEFCYTVVFPVKGGTDSGKVFVKQDPVTGKVIATPELTVWEI